MENRGDGHDGGDVCASYSYSENDRHACVCVCLCLDLVSVKKSMF